MIFFDILDSFSNDCYQFSFSDKPSVRVTIHPPPPVNELDKVNVQVVCEVTAGNPEVLQVVRWYLNGTLLRVKSIFLNNSNRN